MSEAPEQTLKSSVCPLDCPDNCSLQVTVENNEISKVKGSRVNPYTAGAICDKVAKYYPDFVHGEQRLRTPLLRTSDTGQTVNALIDAHMKTDIVEGACYNETFVELQPL